MSGVSDFRSDTVTRPSREMLRAMASAELGDDVLDGDPTVRRLERRVADWLGLADALFVPSGTMANQVAVGAWTSPGDEVVAERSSHVVAWECGALAALHGVQPLTLHADDGRLDPAELASMVRGDPEHNPRTALFCAEQTFMGSGEGPGGRVVPLESLAAVREVARGAGARVHMDGARLANAVVASGIGAERWAGCADSVSLALSKGLGAPVGSLLAASDPEFLARARIVRKRLGGGMRQAGVLAAAGLFALERNLERLAEDHALARELARRLASLPGVGVDPAAVETNVVMARVSGSLGSAQEVSDRLREQRVLVLPMNERTLRFVTHADVGPQDIDRLERALGAILAGAGGREAW